MVTNKTGFVSENDTDQEIKDNDYTWFIMPVEGRKHVSSCIVYFAVSVCPTHKNKVVAAVIDTPALGEAFWSEEKKGALLEGLDHLI
jgi:myo-inositol-1(or 4)-monophosphatase